MSYISSRVKETFYKLFYHLFYLVLTIIKASILVLTLLILGHSIDLTRLTLLVYLQIRDEIALLVY